MPRWKSTLRRRSPDWPTVGATLRPCCGHRPFGVLARPRRAAWLHRRPVPPHPDPSAGGICGSGPGVLDQPAAGPGRRLVHDQHAVDSRASLRRPVHRPLGATHRHSLVRLHRDIPGDHAPGALARAIRGQVGRSRVACSNPDHAADLPVADLQCLARRAEYRHDDHVSLHRHRVVGGNRHGPALARSRCARRPLSSRPGGPSSRSASSRR